MQRTISFLFFLILSQSLTPSWARAGAINPDLPYPLDQERYLFERYWEWLKVELNAPPKLPWPTMEIEPLPPTVKMAFSFPTADEPWQKTRIIISPRAIDRASGSERLTVVGEVAHEIVHYALVLLENNWDVEAHVLKNDKHHHCNHDFMRLTGKIADFIWDTYHSNDAVRSINHMVQFACWRDGHEISSNRRYGTKIGVPLTTIP